MDYLAQVNTTSWPMVIPIETTTIAMNSSSSSSSPLFSKDNTRVVVGPSRMMTMGLPRGDTFVTSKWLQVAYQRYQFNTCRPLFSWIRKLRTWTIYGNYHPKRKYFNIETSYSSWAFWDGYFPKEKRKILNSNYLLSNISNFIIQICILKIKWKTFENNNTTYS